MRLICLSLTFLIIASAHADFPELFNSEPESDKTLMPAEQAAKKFALPDGFKVNVFAAEPDVQNPIAMAWDAKGRLWIAENYTYAERGQRFQLDLRDRVVIFDNTAGEHFNQRTVFTDNVQMLTGIELFLGIIGAMTLVVGGIGVANIMYAVVKERTREIGVKMALGARRGWITGPIVLEGMLYTLFGGVIGLLMAVGIIAVLEMIPTEGNAALEMLGKPTLSVPIGIGTALILGFIGLAAGYFPARRASGIDPAETLRYE